MTASALAGLPDAVLADRARGGDPRAFTELLRRYQRPMYSLAVRLVGSHADAEDVVQDAFVTAWRTLPGFRGDAAFSTWLYRVVTNRALSALRRRRPVLDPSAGVPRPAPRHDEPDARAECAELAASLRAALDTLPVDLRVAWLLREAEHCSYEEVATIVGTSVSTVRGRIARARHALAGSMAAWR